ncbi:hypothetical protein ED236_00350 [Pseudomethylobacillus aquaticus]|uniref:Uncharacterized protein n=1 Tax=Pseudomethylobacillus aquaticus TaxID=2676064 RepID=A0A3N0V5D3_9PROT|nr:hypothetical protein [Pseudomethylobacillus aquaticus]ROH87979.1 hypothetical protein ED236_00350 [Pseudomethylobacillus aquaticus]
MTDSPAFSRTNAQGEPLVDMRGNTPRWIVDVIDAVSQSRGDDGRFPLVNEILADWARAELHRTSLINRICGDNPLLSEGRK